MAPSDDEPTRYQIDYSDIFEIELEKGYLYLSRFIGPEKAHLWVAQVKETCVSIAEHPYQYAALIRKPNLRRVLVGRYHVIYLVVEPASDESEGTVRILNVIHSASRRAGY